MAKLRELRLKARRLGIDGVRDMDEDELREAISDANGSSTKTKSKKAVVKAVKSKRGPGRPRKVVEDDDDEDEAPRKRGRPPGTKNKTGTAKRGPGRPRKDDSEETPKRRGRPPKSEKATTKKRSNGTVGRPVGSGTGTRVGLSDRIKWNADFDFREGSSNQYILEAIRKAAKKYKDTADIREEVFETLVGKLNKTDELTFNERATGKPYKGEKAEKMLRFRINYVMFTFAKETDQHDGSNGGTATKKRGRPAKGETVKKRGPGRPRKVVDEDEDDDEETPRRRGRPAKKRGPGRPPKSETVKRGPGRPKGSGTKKRGPGRPKGSKNRR